MLKQRILTALILVPLAFLLIFQAPPAVFRTAISLILLLSSLEYARLANLRRIGAAVLIILQSVIFLLLFNYWDTVIQLELSVLVAACLTWCLMLLRLVTFRPDRPPPFGHSILGFACAVASMTFAWVALAALRDMASGEILILYLLLIVWAADIGAYFAGHRFGGPRLAPNVSPSKTWSGFWGGLGSAVLLASLLALALPSFVTGPLTMAWLAAVTMLASVGGDLFISAQKRTVKLKDTGHLLPGHGGLLDRLDSLIAAAPFFALGMLLVQR